MIRTCVLILFVFYCGMLAGFAQQKSLPNIILIIADDLGYSDLASYGNGQIHTPHIDALGTGGARFTTAYVTSPICAPSRMSIMTGRYQQRFGCEFMPYDKFDPSVKKNITRHFFSFKKKPQGIADLHPDFFLSRSEYNTDVPAAELTIADLLKKKGYATGLVGKWNLSSSVDVHPDQHGFDYSYYFDGALSRYVDDPVDNNRYVNLHLPWAFSEIPAWAPRHGSTAIKEGRTPVTDSGYLTFSFAQKANQFIDRNKAHPFFLTLSFNAPHDPFQVPVEYFNRLPQVTDTVKRVYYGMIEALDDAVGMVLNKLEQEGISENTLIFFISDNGGATYTRATDNAPLRGGKCTHFEGGISVPFFIRFPGRIKNGTVYQRPVTSMDIFATIAAASGAIPPTDRIYDGINLLPFLNDEQTNPHEDFYWRSGYSKAIRKGDWKLYVNEKNKVSYLFNLANDREEKIDLSDKFPEKLSELKKDLKDWEEKNTIPPLWPSAADVMIEVRGKHYRFPS